MNKIIAIIMVLAMVMCGTAFAATVPQSINAVLGIEYEYSSSVSFIGTLIGSDIAEDSIYVVCFDNGWYLEYRTKDGFSYVWQNEAPILEDVGRLAGTMTAMFDCGDVSKCFAHYGGNTILLTTIPWDDERVYSNTEDFLVAFTAMFVI